MPFANTTAFKGLLEFSVYVKFEIKKKQIKMPEMYHQYIHAFSCQFNPNSWFKPFDWVNNPGGAAIVTTLSLFFLGWKVMATAKVRLLFSLHAPGCFI